MSGWWKLQKQLNKIVMRKCMLLAIMMISSFLLHAQKNYAVMVTDSKTGKPIAGAAVKIMSTGKIINTSQSGNVVLLVSPDDSLQVSAKGYKDRKLNMAGQFTALSIILDALSGKDKITSIPKKKKQRKH
jgi:hypothetical protein